MSNEPRKSESTSPEEDLRARRGQMPEDDPNRPGAEAGSGSPDADELPSHPTDSESAVGDTDQHSSA
jgi:hypothetical protein